MKTILSIAANEYQYIDMLKVLVVTITIDKAGATTAVDSRRFQ